MCQSMCNCNNKEQEKAKTEEEEDSDISNNTQTFQEALEVCKLCSRDQVTYFYGNEEQIERLPFRSLTLLLR